MKIGLSNKMTRINGELLSGLGTRGRPSCWLWGGIMFITFGVAMILGSLVDHIGVIAALLVLFVAAATVELVIFRKREKQKLKKLLKKREDFLQLLNGEDTNE